MDSDAEITSDAIRSAEGAMAAIEAISTVFGRLVYSAAWDSTAGGYRLGPRSEITRRESIDTVFSRARENVFREWLSLNLERQRRDLMRFADSDGPGARD